MIKWFKEGLKYEAFLNTDTEEMKRKALKRWETMVVPTEIKEKIDALEEGYILAFMRLSCPDTMVILPYLQKLHELNPRIEYSILLKKEHEELLKSIVGHEDTHVPTLVFYTKEGEIKGILEEYPERFKNRLKGLDEEDRNELVTRYRRGYYNKELIEGILTLLS